MYHPLSPISIALLVAASSATTNASQAPGYFTGFSTLPANSTFSFGRNYAVLNLDLINGLVDIVSDTDQGRSWINATTTWIDAVHAQNPVPLTFFTRIYSVNARNPDIAGGFTKTFSALAPGVESDNATHIYPAFVPRENYDIVLQKIGYTAGNGNELELILRAQKIETVILSGIRTAGVIMSTAYRLFELDYNVFVIGETCIEYAPEGSLLDRAIKQGAILKLPANVITLDQALEALKRSGPAIY